MRLLVDSVTDYAMFTLDTDGIVTTWNAGAERLTGYRAEEIVGRHVSCFYPEPDVADGTPERELAIATADGHYESEGWRCREDGSVYWANVLITALRGDDGRLLGFGTVTRDLTERKRGEDALRESEERFRLLVSSVADYAIFLLDPDGTVASWNLGAERLKGYRADEIVGQHFSRFYTDEDRRNDVPGNGLRHAIEHGRWESEGWRVRRDGSRFWAHVVITALHGPDGRHRGFAKVTRDLTDRKRSEDALRGILEREREATARLRELDRVKNELVTVVAHDLRAPVGVVESFLFLLREDWAIMPEAEKLELLDRAAVRLEAIGAFVDDVFDLARIEAGELGVTTVEVDLAVVVEQVLADAAVSSPGREIAAEIEPGSVVLGDELRIWQVLANLVSNALKFSPSHEPITITTARDGGEVVVAVRDRGPGIPADQHDLLFQRFVRLPGSDDAPGSGIGLFIARSLVEAQGGRMWIDSTPGSGSTFSFRLPAAPLAG
jgi:PAS domain S-box-containing protein